MNKKQLLRHLQEDVFCRIGRSKIHGIGVIAIKNMPKGTNPFRRATEFKLVKFKMDEFKKLIPSVKKMVLDFFSQEKGSVLIPDIGVNAIDISFFMNHSTNPNVAYDKRDDFITKRRIKKGEELTVDYKSFSD